MRRRRISLARPGLAERVGRMLVSLLALALVFYGAMTVLAALGLSAATINGICADRTILHALETITPQSIDGRDRIIIAAAGLLALAIFAPLAWRSLPRAHATRAALRVDASGDAPPARGITTVAPRVLERTAERALARESAIRRVRAGARQGGVEVRVELDPVPRPLVDGLGALQRRVEEGLRDHGIPPVAIDVTLVGAASRPIDPEEGT